MLWQRRVARRNRTLHGKLSGAYEVEIRIRGLGRAISRLPNAPQAHRVKAGIDAVTTVCSVSREKQYFNFSIFSGCTWIFQILGQKMERMHALL